MATDWEAIRKENERITKAAEYLNSVGYCHDFADQLWMEDYVLDHKWRDVLELMDDYANYKLQNKDKLK